MGNGHKSSLNGGDCAVGKLLKDVAEQLEDESEMDISVS